MDEGALPAAIGSHQSVFLVRFENKGDILKSHGIRPGIGEVHMVERQAQLTVRVQHCFLPVPRRLPSFHYIHIGIYVLCRLPNPHDVLGNADA